MANEHRILEEVEKTLHSFDNDEVLEGNPFLASRIKARMDSRAHSRNRGIPLRIALKYGVMVLILLINLITAVHYFESRSALALHEKLVSDLEQDFQIDQTHNSF